MGPELVHVLDPADAPGMTSPDGSNSMTGSSCGAPSTHLPAVCLALGQLRSMVRCCVWVLLFAIVVQAAVWSAATFGDLRYERLESGGEAPLVVERDAERAAAAAELDPLGDAPLKSMKPGLAADPNLVPSSMDKTFEVTATIAGALGRLATAALLPLIVLGVMLAAGSATDGVERTVRSFAWCTVTLFLVFPIAASFGMPWRDGSLWDYAALAERLDRGNAGHVDHWLQYLILPVTTMLTVIFAGRSFAAGVAAGLLRKEDLSLDPMLEREAANVRPGSNYGSRTARAMNQMAASFQPTAAVPAPAGVVPAPASGETVARPGPGPGPALAMPPSEAGAVPHGGHNSAEAPAPAGTVGPTDEPAALPPTGTDGPPMDTAAGPAPRRII